jgi:hypothetical protein
MENTIYITNNNIYTEQEAQHFKNLLSPSNYEALISHLCDPDLALYIEGFTEQDGVLFLQVNGEMISVTEYQSMINNNKSN